MAAGRLAILLACLAACVPAGAPASARAPVKHGVAAGHRRRCHRARRHRCPVKKRKKAAAIAPRGGATSTGPVVWSGVPSSVAPGSSGEAPVEGSTPSSPVSESPAASGPAHVQVTAEDTEAFRFVLSRPSVPAGKVVIEFVNHGQDEHNLNALEAAEGDDVGSIPNTAPGGHPAITLDMKPGSYTLFCSLPGHEAKGMKATLVVE